MNKKDIRVGDRVTYKEIDKKEIKVLIIDCEGLREDFKDYLKMDNNIQILKIERPQYATVYERKEILDDTEKEYLSNVIRPFRGEVLYIQKLETETYKRKYIYIKFKNDSIAFPYFPEGKDMYKGMALGKEYTLKELGLE